MPDAADFPDGCRFHPRCPLALERCRSEVPPERERAQGAGATTHRSACWAIDERPELDLLEGLERLEATDTQREGA